MKLYGYWRSSAAYRVRIALHYKNIPFQSIPVHLVDNGGEQHFQSYKALNATELVPTLVDGDLVLNQSLAIIDYLEEVYPSNPLYPRDIGEKAQVKALAFDIACEVHPLNNLRVQQYLNNELSLNNEEKRQWLHHWITLGFQAIEQKLNHTSGAFCFGDDVTVADITLVPQVYNAQRFKVNLAAFPNILKIVENCRGLDAFIEALPENQVDAQ